MHHERVLVAAFVAGEPQVRQSYFLFCARAGAFGAAAFAARAGRTGALRTAGFALRDLATTRGAFSAGARLGSGVGVRCTIVKRVWSPIV